MVWSALVEPLVTPLVGSGAGGLRRSRLSGTRIVATALACTALLAVAGVEGQRTAAEIDRALTAQKSEISARNPHKKPAPTPYRVLLETVFATRDDLLELLPPPAEAPEFERETLDAHRLKHKRDPIYAGPSLGLGVLLDRLAGGSSATFLRFQAGVHRSGIPTSV